jgi:hypothetical protein
MDKPLAEAYASLEQDIAATLQEHRGNSSVVSTALDGRDPCRARPSGGPSAVWA